jgi:hypothetical protein
MRRETAKTSHFFKSASGLGLFVKREEAIAGVGCVVRT